MHVYVSVRRTESVTASTAIQNYFKGKRVANSKACLGIRMYEISFRRISYPIFDPELN